MSRIILWIMVIYVSGCASKNQLFDQQNTLGLQQLTASVEYLSIDKKSLPIDHFPNQIRLIFPAIAGEIFGSPKADLLFDVSLKRGQKFTLDLNSSITKVDQLSRPLKKQWFEQGLKISPKTTKLLRVATFPFNEKTAKSIGGGGFIDPISKDNLILVYVSNSSQITGHVTLNEVNYVHDIHIPSAGYHLLRIKDLSQKHKVLEYVESIEVIKFSIHVDHLQNV